MTKTKILIGIMVFVALCGFALLASSIWYLVTSPAQPSAQYFLTVSELLSRNEKLTSKAVRISGAVLGDTIKYDRTSGKLSFFIVEVPADYALVEQQGGLDVVLRNAVNDPNRPKIQIVYSGAKPELLRHMAQAIVTGQLKADGIFYADEILLKCPSRYEKAVPDQAVK